MADRLDKTAGRLDIVIFGATGFTGMHCIPYLHRLAKSNEHNFSWGVAGRSKDKLKKVLRDMGAKAGADLSSIPIITSNIDDDESLFKMAGKTKLVINCVGPYILYGEKVVDACLKAGTHHIDVSGEPEYMEYIQLKKNETAMEKGVYIVSACGMDSIPCDLGVVYLEQNFEGVLNSVVSYLKFSGSNSSGPVTNVGTWASVVHNVNDSKLKRIRRELFPKKLPIFRPKLKNRTLPHKTSIINGWAVPFLGADRSVVERTQRYLYEEENKRPVQVDTLCVLNSLFQVIVLATIGIELWIFSKFECGRNLLIKYAHIFTFGIFSNSQPSQETIENSNFEIVLCGEGWKNQSDITQPCDGKLKARIKGKNPAYGATCACLVLAAITVLNERKKLAGNGKGGVFPPGAAFAKTSMVKRLNENGVTFEIISDSSTRDLKSA